MKTLKENSKIVSLTLIAGALFVSGYVLGNSQTTALATETVEGEKLAYMVVSGRLLSDGDLGPYAKAAGPGAIKAGIKTLARSSTIEVFEGNWPSEKGFLIVETFTSMKALKEFWYSDAYKNARKLRKGILELDFVVAIEGEK